MLRGARIAEDRTQPTPLPAAALSPEPLRRSVLVADGQALFRDALARLIESRGDLAFLGEAADGRTAIKLIRERQPRVAVLDLRLPLLDGFAIARLVQTESAGTRVLLLSDDASGAIILRAFEAGATGFESKDAESPRLLMAIASVGRGIPFLAPELSGAVAAGLEQRARVAPVMTSREIEIVAGLARGDSASALAERLHIAVPTVKTHIQMPMQS